MTITARSANARTDSARIAGDVLFAAAITAFCIVVAQHQPVTEPDARDPDVWQTLAIVAACAPLALRRIAPAWGAMITTLGTAWYLARGYVGGPVLLAPFVAMFYAGYGVGKRGLQYLIVAFAALVIAATLASPVRESEWMWSIGWPPIAAALAYAGAARRRHEEERGARAEAAEVREHAEARRQLAEERVRMARDLHDVVGHSLASITLLAGAGARRVDGDPDSAREVLEEIRSVSVTALADVRRAIDALGEPGRSVLAEQEVELQMLLDRVRRVGLQVTDRIEVDPSTLPHDVGVAVRRIVQESLTNVMRHSGARAATVELAAAGDGVELRVADDGSCDGELAEGNGIAGMRDRVEELGGQLAVTRTPDGGVVVTAWLPVPQRVES